MSRPNILFLMVDCMRADTLWDRRRYPSLPNLDRLCEQSSVFQTAIAAFTNTTPSVATMLTGLPPSEHGIRSLLGYKLRPDVRTLAQDLQAAGYYTAAETTGPLFPLTELNRGFSHYRRRERNWYLSTAWGDDVRATLRERRMPEPWFLFLHIWELHWPRRAPDRFNHPRYGRSLYQRSIAYVDHLLGTLLETVDLEHTAVILTGDHGEGIAGAIDDPRPAVQLGLHWAYRLTRTLPVSTKKRILTLAKHLILVGRGRPQRSDAPASRQELAGHAALCVYDYLIRVPVVLHAPGFAPPSRIDHQIRHLDLTPTILDLAGLEGSRPDLSRSLLPMARGDERGDRPALAEASQSMLFDPVSRLVGYRTGQYKLIYAPENPEIAPEVYEPRADPEELLNLAGEQPGLVDSLREQAEHLDFRDRSGSVEAQPHERSPNGTEQRMSAEEEQVLRERLEQLGYLE